MLYPKSTELEMSPEKFKIIYLNQDEGFLLFLLFIVEGCYLLWLQYVREVWIWIDFWF
jgi:hypothetical protein